MRVYEKEQKTKKLSSEGRRKAVEIARLIAELPEQEQAIVYYMLKGSEFFNKKVQCRIS